MIWPLLLGCPKPTPIEPALPPVPPAAPAPPAVHERHGQWCSDQLVQGEETAQLPEPGPCPDEGTLASCVLPGGDSYRVYAVGHAKDILAALHDLGGTCRVESGSVTVVDLPLVRMACSNPSLGRCYEADTLRATDTFSAEMDTECTDNGGEVVSACPDVPGRVECPVVVLPGVRLLVFVYPPEGRPGDCPHAP